MLKTSNPHEMMKAQVRRDLEILDGALDSLAFTKAIDNIGSLLPAIVTVAEETLPVESPVKKHARAIMVNVYNLICTGDGLTAVRPYSLPRVMEAVRLATLGKLIPTTDDFEVASDFTLGVILGIQILETIVGTIEAAESTQD